MFYQENRATSRRLRRGLSCRAERQEAACEPYSGGLLRIRRIGGGKRHDRSDGRDVWPSGSCSMGASRSIVGRHPVSRRPGLHLNRCCARGRSDDLPLGTPDPDIVLWAEREVEGSAPQTPQAFESGEVFALTISKLAIILARDFHSSLAEYDLHGACGRRLLEFLTICRRSRVQDHLRAVIAWKVFLQRIAPCRVAGRSVTIKYRGGSACAVSALNPLAIACRRYNWEFHGPGCWRSSIGRATVL